MAFLGDELSGFEEHDSAALDIDWTADQLPSDTPVAPSAVNQ